MKPILIAPSLLSADFGNLDRDLEWLNKSNASWFHVDVMDGIFVPNISFGFPVMEALKKKAKKPLDVHLMIAEPIHYLKRFKDAGAANLTIHIELGDVVPGLLKEIKTLGMNPGVAISPDTPIESLRSVLPLAYHVCIMSVYPGFGGQKFIPATLERILQVKKLNSECNTNALIEIDGGVTLENAPALIQHCADILVAGNTVFGSKNPSETIDQLQKN